MYIISTRQLVDEGVYGKRVYIGKSKKNKLAGLVENKKQAHKFTTKADADMVIHILNTIGNWGIYLLPPKQKKSNN